MNQFIIGVLATLSGSLLIFILSFVSKSIRALLISLLNRLVKIDIVASYKNSYYAQNDIIKSLKKADKVKMVMGRGNELQRETFDPVFQEPRRFSSVQLLLPKTNISDECINWTKAREDEIMQFDSAFKEGVLIKQIETVVEFASNVFDSNDKFEYRRFNAPHLGKFIITENEAFYYFLANSSHGRENTVYRVKSGTQTYRQLNRIFECIWEKSE